MRDPNARLPRKIGGAPHLSAGQSSAPAARQQPLPPELLNAVNADGTPDLKKLEAAGLLPKFLRLWNNPAVLQQLKQACAAKAEKPAKVKPAAVAASAAAAGRNDPCPCGSGKKFKKCCAAK